MSEIATQGVAAQSRNVTRTGSAATVELAAPRSHAAAAWGVSFLALVLKEVRADRWLYVGIAIYTVAAGLLAAALGRSQGFQPFLYLGEWITVAFGLLIPCIIIRAAIAGAIRRPIAPLSGFCSELAGAMRPRLMAGFLLFCAIVIFYGSFTSVKNLLPHLFDFNWDVRLANFGRALHWGSDPATVLAELIGPRVTLAIDYVYGGIWFALLLGISAWAATSTRNAHLRVQFFMTFLVCWIALGNVLAGLFLSGGPVYFGDLTGDHTRFAVLEASLDGTMSQASARYLWEFSQQETVSLGTGISAFPSMHVSICMLLTLFLWSIDQRFGWLGVLFTAVMLVGSVRLGWHYAIDGYASIILTPLVWRAVQWMSGGAQVLPVTSPSSQREIGHIARK